MKNEKSTQKNKQNREEYLYHNTVTLMSRYRDVVWSVEASVMQAKINFELEFDCDIEEFLELSYAAGADLSGTNVEEQMRCIEKSKKMLKIIDNAIEILRRKHKNGESYYWILYYTYLSEQMPANTEEIISRLREHIRDMSWKTYYRKRKEAINCLSSVLWGYTSKDCIEFVDQFLPDKSAKKE